MAAFVIMIIEIKGHQIPIIELQGAKPVFGSAICSSFSPFCIEILQKRGKMLKKHLLTSEFSAQHLLANGNIQQVFFILENSPVEDRHPQNYGKYCYNLFFPPRHIHRTTWNRRLVEILVSLSSVLTLCVGRS